MVRSFLMVGALACTVLTGCGESGPFDYVKIHGKVTYPDGTAPPAAGMQLQFEALDAPQVAGMTPRPGAAQVGSDGTFANATSYKYGDGLIPGKHKVAFQFATDAKGKLVVPKEYTHLSTTPLTIETGDGNIEIQVPKP